MISLRKSSRGKAVFMMLVLALSALLGACSGESVRLAHCRQLPALAEQLPGIQDVAAATAHLQSVAAMSDCEGTQATQAATLMYDSASFLAARGLLRGALVSLAELAIKTGAFPDIDVAQAAAKAGPFADQAVTMIEAELCSRGKTTGCASRSYTTWETLGEQLLAQARRVPTAVGEAAFKQQIESLSNSTFLDGNAIELLVDGPASFTARKQAIESAQTSIWLITWAMLEDNTGRDTAALLLAAKARGVDVRVIVDGQVASRPGYDGTKVLRDAGIPVKRWADPTRPGQGVHLKAMIVDGNMVIGGGMNIGDAYSHHPASTKPKWRDTDAKIRGPVAAQAAQTFARLWGEGLTSPDPASVARAGTTRIAFTAQIPDERYIQLAILKSIESARSRIDIENAYFISTPDLEGALLAALARGVRVRILTNSLESIDEKIVMRPILESLPKLVDAGAQVYLKKGATLHSKFMAVDGRYAWIGSYNLHPRSIRYEGENIFQILDDTDTGFAGTLISAFENDLAVALRITASREILIPEDSLAVLVERYFFDQL
ncbi:MAG: phospholipase D-like domain-containing protein [Betaproteobacteria bacterium]